MKSTSMSFAHGEIFPKGAMISPNATVLRKTGTILKSLNHMKFENEE